MQIASHVLKYTFDFSIEILNYLDFIMEQQRIWLQIDSNFMMKEQRKLILTKKWF